MIKVHIVTEKYTKDRGWVQQLESRKLDLESLIRVVGFMDKLDKVNLTKDIYLGIDPYAEDVYGKLEYIAANSLEKLKELQYEYSQDI